MNSDAATAEIPSAVCAKSLGQWARACGAGGVYLVTAWVLAQAAWLGAMSSVLQAAAEAAAQEAVLPKATLQSVDAVARWRAAGWGLRELVDPPMVECNGRPTGGLIAPRSGDAVAVTVTVDAHAALPRVLRPFGWSLASDKVRVRSVVQAP